MNLDFSVVGEKNEINLNLVLLEDAIRKKRVVEFKYTNNDNLEKKIQVTTLYLRLS